MDLEIDAEGIERLAKRAKVVRGGEVTAVATSTAVYVALLDACDGHKNRCEEPIFENQCILG